MHEGHRNRLTGKVKDGGVLYEHELMEVLLFYAVPRKDVNDVAHALVSRFGSAERVFRAGVDELAAVDGVGETTAKYIACTAEILERCGKSYSFADVSNTEEFRKFLSVRPDSDGERLEACLMDKDGRLKRIYATHAPKGGRAGITTDEILKVVSIYKPYGLFVANFRVDGDGLPEEFDDKLAEEISGVCKLCGTRFYDYCIVSSDKKIYSYFVEDRGALSSARGAERGNYGR